MNEHTVLLALLARYGYLMIAAGTFFEGETVVLLAGMMAHEQLFSLRAVMMAAVCGVLVSDIFFFFLGRRCGEALLHKFPALRHPASRIDRILARYGWAVFFGVRFIWGGRMAAPMVLGMRKIPVHRFLLLNVAGAVSWCILFSILGYAFGHFLEKILGDLHQSHHLLLAGLFMAACILSVRPIRLLLKKKDPHGMHEDPEV